MKMIAQAAIVAMMSVAALPANAELSPGLTVAADHISPPPAGEGQIVFYRRGTYFDAAISCAVHEDDAILTHLTPGRFGIVNVAPGVHNFTVASEATDVMRVDVHAGQTYYGFCEIKFGISVGRPELTLVSRDVFFALAPKLKPVKGTVLTDVAAVKSPSPDAVVAVSAANLSSVDRAVASPQVVLALVPAAALTPPASSVAAPVQGPDAVAARPAVVAISAVGTPVMVERLQATTVTTATEPAPRRPAVPVTVSDYPLDSDYAPPPAEIFIRTLPPRP